MLSHEKALQPDVCPARLNPYPVANDHRFAPMFKTGYGVTVEQR